MTATVLALGLTACGAAPAAPAASSAAPGAASDDDVAALQAVGFETELAPGPSASAGAPDRPGRGPAARKFLRKNTLHGEWVVQGKDGVRTLVVQRGTVTATDGKTLTVKSSDGFTIAWTAGAQLRVVQDKKKVDAGAIKNGAEVGVAGGKDGTVTTARLVVIG